MIRNTLFVILLMVSSLFAACAEGVLGDAQKEDDTKEICFSLNLEGGLTMSPTRSSVSLDGMKWKIFCFDDRYNYLFDKTGSMGDEIKVSVTEGAVYRFLILCAATDNFPKLTSGKTYWDLEAYAPLLPLTDPTAMLVSRGTEKDGTLRVTATSASVQVTLAPRTSRVVLQKDPQTASDITVNSVTFENAAASVPHAHIEPQYYSEYESLPATTRKSFQCTPQKDVFYMLPDLCAESFGTVTTLNVTHPTSGEQQVRVTMPKGLALNVGGGKTYYIEISADADGKATAVWTTHTAPKTLKLATQNLWGQSTSVVLDYFNKIDVDVLCAQECSKLSESDIQAQGLYVHTHSNNGQGECSIISRYPFSGITPNKYGAYIDLGEGVTVLVMNCHGAYYPYGPYQLNGIAYKGYEGTDDVDYVVKVNKEARQGMVDKLLEDFKSSTTPFVCISGDFNEPSWLDWTEGAKAAGLAPYVVQWPTTHALWKGGIKGDAYRTVHSDPVTHPGFTWTPRPSAKDTKDRLDLTLYALSSGLEVQSCQIIGESTETSDIVLSDWKPFEEVFDHRGLRTTFVFTK